MQKFRKRLIKDDGSLQLNLYKGQKEIIDVAQKQGYQLISECREGIYDFSKNKLNHILPQGFHFKTLADCDRKELQNATWRDLIILENQKVVLKPFTVLTQLHIELLTLMWWLSMIMGHTPATQ